MPKRNQKPSKKDVSETTSDETITSNESTAPTSTASTQSPQSEMTLPKVGPKIIPTYYDAYDAEGIERGDVCPACQSDNTVTYVYHEGFIEIDCRDCGFSSEAAGIADLTRYGGELLEASPMPPIPLKKIKA
ncbi:MAG: hypothetical protein AAF267_01070 [Deinococcota bacterium]